jgi:NAD(P)-dependent dehydrogenase (short-subunit alcohol dehydrogenase family)
MEKGKVAIVTGGGRGIGKAVVKKLLQDGWRVVFAEMDAEAGRETLQEYHSLGELVFIHADVSSETAVNAIIKETVDTFRRIDALINNAGIMIRKPISKLSLAEWNRVIGVNLTGAFLCAKYAAPHLAKQKGSIINIASTRALMSEPDTEAYSATKGGLVALTHALAVSLGPKVRVNCISPGWIETSEWQKKKNRKVAKHSEADNLQHPAGRVGIPEDISSMVSYIISDEAGFITGANFVVDGGMTRKMVYE